MNNYSKILSENAHHFQLRGLKGDVAHKSPKSMICKISWDRPRAGWRVPEIPLGRHVAVSLWSETVRNRLESVRTCLVDTWPRSLVRALDESLAPAQYTPAPSKMEFWTPSSPFWDGTFTRYYTRTLVDWHLGMISNHYGKCNHHHIAFL